MSSLPMPVLACTLVSRTAVIVPTNQAAPAVVMNSAIVVRRAGTPTLRAATSSPPVANTQLPKRVRSSTQVATAVTSTHHRIAIRNGTPTRVNVEANTAFAESYPGTAAMPEVVTV